MSYAAYMIADLPTIASRQLRMNGCVEPTQESGVSRACAPAVSTADDAYYDRLSHSEDTALLMRLQSTDVETRTATATVCSSCDLSNLYVSFSAFARILNSNERHSSQ